MKEMRDGHVFKLALRDHWIHSGWSMERWELNKLRENWIKRSRRRICRDDDFLKYAWLRRTPGGEFHWEWDAWSGAYNLYFEKESDAMAFHLSWS